MTAYHDSSFIDPDVSAAAERAGCHPHPNARGRGILLAAIALLIAISTIGATARP